MYLSWQDTTHKKPIEQKVKEGIEIFLQRFGIKPTIILMNEQDLKHIDGYVTQSRTYIRRNIIYLGLQEQ
jgi:hypothetical protein